MHVRLIAVGTRPPGWVRAACEDYITRLRSGLPVELIEVGAGPRSGGTSARAVAIEGQRVLDALHREDYVVTLDERGSEFSTRELAAWLCRASLCPMRWRAYCSSSSSIAPTASSPTTHTTATEGSDVSPAVPDS